MLANIKQEMHQRSQHPEQTPTIGRNLDFLRRWSDAMPLQANKAKFYIVVELYSCGLDHNQNAKRIQVLA